MGKEIKSSNLAFVEYDSSTSTLEIEFRTGAVYIYSPISEEGYKQLCNADSPGGYFAENIKNNKNITCVKVRGKD